MFEEMDWEIVTRSTRVLEDSLWVGVRKTALKLSGALWQAARIDELKIKFVLVKRSNRHHAILLNFMTEEHLADARASNPLLEGMYTLNPDGGGKKRKKALSGGVIQTSSMIKRTPWLSSIAAQGGYNIKRFIPEQGSDEFQWLIRFAPGFIHESPASTCPVDAELKGIYCLMDEHKRVLYIGQGEVKARLRRHMWEENICPKFISWTQIDESDVRQSAEDYHLHAHFLHFGKLPPHNTRGGRKPKS